VVDEYQNTSTLAHTETPYSQTHYGSASTPAVNSYDENIPGSMHASESTADEYYSNQQYYGCESYGDDYQVQQTFGQLTLESDSEDSIDAYAEAGLEPDPPKPINVCTLCMKRN
jgi:hypothetical protein